MSTELAEILAQVKAIAARDVEVARILRAIVAYLASQETETLPAAKGKK